jgi:GcrA cell cycle regulator
MVSWTEKRVERLMLLHREGFSATVIAKKLGPNVTKGMVAGKLRRLSLDAQKPTAPPGKRKSFVACEKQAVPAKGTAAPAQSPTVLAKPPSVQQPCEPEGIRIFDLRERHCRWPLGNDRPAKFFCGAPVIPSKSWCEHHYGLAYGHRPTHQNRERDESPGQMLCEPCRNARSGARLLRLFSPPPRPATICLPARARRSHRRRAPAGYRLVGASVLRTLVAAKACGMSEALKPLHHVANFGPLRDKNAKLGIQILKHLGSEPTGGHTEASAAPLCGLAARMRLPVRRNPEASLSSPRKGLGRRARLTRTRAGT